MTRSVLDFSNAIPVDNPTRISTRDKAFRVMRMYQRRKKVWHLFRLRCIFFAEDVLEDSESELVQSVNISWGTVHGNKQREAFDT